MIWRTTFPKGRKISLEVQWISKEKYGPPVPVTLSINRESRNETQRHYLVYLQTTEVLDDAKIYFGRNQYAYFNRLCRLEPKPRPICYNPSRDFLATTFYNVLEPYTQSLYKIVEQRSQHLGKIKAVNIHSCDIGYLHFMSEGENWPNRQGLLKMHNLKEIRCIGLPSNNLQQKTEREEIFRNFFINGFELEKRTFPECEIRKVLFFEDWAELMAKVTS